MRSLAAAALLLGSLAAQNHTHGDVVGSIDDTSAIVWTRASSPALVSVIHSTSPTLIPGTETSAVAVDGTTDFTAKVPLSGLAADTLHYFATRLVDPANPQNQVVGPIGSFRTAPRPNTAALVRVVVTGDIIDQRGSEIYGSMRAHDPHFFLLLGDFPYADGARTVPEYWQKHKAVRNNPALLDLFRFVPLVATWDDHEVANDWDAAVDPVLVQNGTAAWRTYFPIPSGASEIYRTRRWGSVLEVFVLDARSHRGVNGDPDLPGKPMLGRTQLDWLKAALRASTATFKVIGTSVPLRFGTTGPDCWDGYMRERAELLEFVQQEPIANVVFVTADQHWAASHHHREGVREFQFGPAATTTRTPRAFGDPERVFVRPQSNYGLLTVDPTASPPTLTAQWHASDGTLWRREVMTAGPRARLGVTSDLPEMRFRLEGGPFTVHNSGSAVDLRYLEAGTYRASFDLPDAADGRPADLELTLPPGSRAALAADLLDAPDATSPRRVLFADGFEAPLAGYSITDDGTISGPSTWFTDGGYLVQNSNVFSGSTGVEYPGTVAVQGSQAWTNYTLRVRAQSLDNDGFGVVFRHRGAGDYYRVAMDSQRGFRQLVSRRSGQFRLLAQDAVPYQRYRWYEIEVVAIGNRIRVLVDDVVVFDVVDADHPSGAVGLYCYGNQATLFDDLVVRAGDATVPRRLPLASDDFGDGRTTGWSFVDQGTVSAPSAWSESGGVLHQTSNINDGNLDPAAVQKLGTLGIFGPSAGDCTIEVDVTNADDDAVGVVFRYSGPNDHYRFSMDSERSYRRLAKVSGGTWTTLWEDRGAGYAVGVRHRIRVESISATLRAFLDDQLLATVTDSTHATGRAGLYCWGSDAVEFDRFRLLAEAPTRGTFAAIGAGHATALVGRAPTSAGRVYALALAATRAPGIPLSLLDPSDPRVLELTADGLFWSTLGQNSLLPGFASTVGADGALSASIAWPAVPGLSGLRFFAGGFTLDATGRIGELVSTVEVVVP